MDRLKHLNTRELKNMSETLSLTIDDFKFNGLDPKSNIETLKNINNYIEEISSNQSIEAFDANALVSHEINKSDDELLRKSKQLSRLTTERFARIEDRLDILEEDQ